MKSISYFLRMSQRTNFRHGSTRLQIKRDSKWSPIQSINLLLYYDAPLGGLKKLKTRINVYLTMDKDSDFRCKNKQIFWFCKINCEKNIGVRCFIAVYCTHWHLIILTIYCPVSTKFLFCLRQDFGAWRRFVASLPLRRNKSEKFSHEYLESARNRRNFASWLREITPRRFKIHTLVA
jgi:hypothetical protein